MNTRYMSQELVEFMRDQFPAGSRIKLKEMKDPYAPVPANTMGTLENIDDIGTFHVKWDNGRGLGLIAGVDSFSVLPPELTTLKLYMPLTADDNDYGYLPPECMDGSALVKYEDAIQATLEKRRRPEESEYGIMCWYHEDDAMKRKVHSVVFKAEVRKNKLWGVALCRVAGTLNADELNTLKAYITNQAATGWGKSFEQEEIQTEDGNLYVHFWNSDDWSLQTEEERFAPKIAEGLPDICFSTLMTTGELICIKKGETGYYPSEFSTPYKECNVEMADAQNKKLGVTPAQRKAMEVGSMCGWDVPGANPACYGKHDH